VGTLIASAGKYTKTAWDENTASAAALVFIPCLLVAASKFPVETVLLGDTVPCFWLLVDALIVCFTISAVAALIDVLLDVGYFFNKIEGDSIPILAHKDTSYPSRISEPRVIGALIIRLISSCFILLTLSAATNLTLVPLAYNATSAATTATAVYPYPPQCDLLSSPVYNYKLFFGFASIATLFLLLRFGLVTQSRKSPSSYDVEKGAVKKPAPIPAATTTGMAVPKELRSQPPGRVSGDDSEEELGEKVPGDESESDDEAREEKRRHRGKRRRHHKRRRERDSTNEDESEKAPEESNQ
jgi:hypothetical protein